jgi:heme exporter protein D
MMPDLGPYWLEVTAAYVVSLAGLALMVGLVWRRSRKVRAELDEIEARRAGRPGGADG